MSVPTDPYREQIESAIALHRQGHYAQAESAYRQVLGVAPQHPAAWHLLGCVAHEQGRLDEAIQSIHRALELVQFNDAVMLANGGEVLRKLHRLEEAWNWLQRAGALRPDSPEVYYKGGLVQSDLWNTDNAIALFQHTVELNPRHHDAWNNLGCEYSKLNRGREGEACFERALALSPDMPLALNNLGAAYALDERPLEAIPLYRRSLELKPDFAEAHSNLLFALNYDDRMSPDALFIEHRRWGEQHAQHLPPPPAWTQSRRADRPLRVGYLSGDWKSHPVAFFMLSVLRKHDPRRFEIYCYDDTVTHDALSDHLQQTSATWRRIRNLPDQQLIEQVRADQLDILVELHGHTTRNRLVAVAQRMAPVQVTYLGYVNTTGVPSIDYRITDMVCDPPGEPVRHTEQLVRLPTIFCCYSPAGDAPPPTPLPAEQRGYIVFGSLHNLSKLSDSTLDLWAKVLHAVPSAHLRIVRKTCRGERRQPFVDSFARRGIDASRLEFSDTWPSTANHMVHYLDLDISLDVTPWSGHTTTCEALWMGVPMITLYGNRYAGRMVSSVLTQVGLVELIAQSPDEFVEIAARLANDWPRLAQLRRELRARMGQSPLCDAGRFTRELEDAYRTMWQRWCER